MSPYIAAPWILWVWAYMHYAMIFPVLDLSLGRHARGLLSPPSGRKTSGKSFNERFLDMPIVHGKLINLNGYSTKWGPLDS